MKTTFLVQKFFWITHAIVISTLLTLSLVSNASPNLITFQSRLIRPDGQALEATAVNFRFSLTDALGTCVIFQEDFTNRNMAGSKGLINLTLGGGSKIYPAGPMTLAEVFNNYNFPTFNCQAGGTVNAGSTDRRRLVMQFNDGSGWQTVPAMDINANPFALQALSAQKLGDFPAADYMRTAALPTCAVSEALSFNGASIVCIAAGGAGGAGTVTQVTSANADIGISTTTTTPLLTLNSGTGNNQIVKLNGSAQLPAVSGVNLTALNAANLASGTVPDARMPALTGDVTMTAGATVTAIAAGAIIDNDINATAAIARSKIASSGAVAFGDVLINDGTGAISSLECANNQIIKFNGAGVAGCAADNAGTGDIINGGNTTAAAVTVGTNDANNFVLETNNSPRLTIDSVGNVGVGTTGPMTKFHIRGAALDTAIVLENSAAALNSKVRTISSAAGALYFGKINDDFATGARTDFQILSNGNVGVGASSPATKFQVSEADSSTVASLINESSTVARYPTNSVTNYTGTFGGNATFSTKVSRGSIASPSAILNGDQIGNIIAYGQYDSTSGSWGAATMIDSVSAGNFSATSFPGDLRFSTTNVGATTLSERVRITANGNVGLGTVAPTRLLQVAGPMKITPTTVPAAPTAGDIYVDSADGNKLKVYDGGVWVAAGGGGTGTVTQVTSANTDIGITNTTTTPELTLNVGVGNNQIVKLNGSAQLPAVSGVNLTALNATNLGSGTVLAARFPAFTGDVTTVAGAVATTIAADAVTSTKILNDEIVNADINSAAAIARTKLANGSNNHVLINSGGGVMSSEAQLAISRGGTGLASYTNNALIMANGTGTALTNATCSTGEILMWNATTWACTNMAASTQGYIKDGGNTFTGTATIGTNSNHNLEIETNGTTKMTVLANGNVGIGTATPLTGKLYVIGSSPGGNNFDPYFGQVLSMTRNNTSGGALTWPAHGIYVTANYSSATQPASSTGIIYGIESIASNLDAATVNTIVGVKGTASNSTIGGGVVTNGYGIYGNVDAAENTITNAYAGYFKTSSIITNGYGVYIDTIEGSNTWGLYQASSTNKNYFAGNVGVGTTSPSQKLEVVGNAKISGQLATGSQTIVGGTSSLNWNNGNSISTDYNCGGTISFANLIDGGTYTLVVTDTGTTQCDFSTTTTGTGAGTVSYRFRPNNNLRTATSHTIYTLMRIGTIVYVSWASGF